MGSPMRVLVFVLLFMAQCIGLVILSTTAYAQQTTLVVKDQPTGKTISFDSIRVVRTRDGATWVSTNATLDLTVSVDEEAAVASTFSIVDGRVGVYTNGTPIRTTLLNLEGRGVEGMQPVPGPYILRLEGASGSHHILINTGINYTQHIGPTKNPKVPTIAATEEFKVTVYRGIFTSPQIKVLADPYSGSKVNVAVPRPSWTDRVVGVIVGTSLMYVNEPLTRGKEQKPRDFSNLWSIYADRDSYELISDGGFTGTACYTIGDVNGALWEGAYVAGGIGTEALTFNVVGAPIFVGNEVRFTQSNTEKMRYYRHNQMSGQEYTSYVEGTFTFILK